MFFLNNKDKNVHTPNFHYKKKASLTRRRKLLKKEDKGKYCSILVVEGSALKYLEGSET